MTGIWVDVWTRAANEFIPVSFGGAFEHGGKESRPFSGFPVLKCKAHLSSSLIAKKTEWSYAPLALGKSMLQLVFFFDKIIYTIKAGEVREGEGL